LRLTVEVSETLQGHVVRLRGEAGLAEAGALEVALVPLAARRPPCVTFEMSELEFISSLAMGVLVAFRRGAVRAGVRVCLAIDLRPPVREALERADVLSIFEAVQCAALGGRRERYPNARDVQRSYGLTWGQLVELEPQLETLLRRARLAGADCRSFMDVERFFGPLRNDLAELIGFAGTHQRDAILGSVGAYEVAYWKLYDAVAGLLPGRAGHADEARGQQRGEMVA
jgi:anti-anti-sigma factor